MHVYMYVCIYMCMYVFIYVYAYIYMYIQVCMTICIYIYIYMHINMYTFRYAYEYIYIYVWIYICISIYIYIYIHLCVITHIRNRDIGPAVRVFANGPGDLGSIPGRVIPKTLKMVLDTTLLNTQHYKVRFKGKVEQSWEWSSALPYTLV